MSGNVKPVVSKSATALAPEFVLRDVNLDYKNGDVCCVVGGVGQGKTTLALGLIQGEMHLQTHIYARR